MQGLSSISDECVVSRRKNGIFVSRKRSVQCSIGTKLAEKGRKSEVESPAREVRRLRSVGHNLFQVESSEHSGSVNFEKKKQQPTNGPK